LCYLFVQEIKDDCNLQLVVSDKSVHKIDISEFVIVARYDFCDTSCIRQCMKIIHRINVSLLSAISTRINSEYALNQNNKL